MLMHATASLTVHQCNCRVSGYPFIIKKKVRRFSKQRLDKLSKIKQMKPRQVCLAVSKRKSLRIL